MELRVLRYFLAVARHQNITRAAEELHLTQEWDKTFPESKEVRHRKITFHNRYVIELAADLYEPKNAKKGSLAAIAVNGPFGAVKEQASDLYAQELARRGFLTIAFDPSFTGESGGAGGRLAVWLMKKLLARRRSDTMMQTK